MQETELIKFENEELGEIKGFFKNGEPWFLAGNVCRSLGIKDTSRAVKQVTERLKIAEYEGAISSSTLVQTRSGKQNVLIIPEAYLYELVFASRKQKAIKFRTWVTSEVLPAIRKHGMYRMEGKLIRRSLTDAIEDSGENDRMYGHGHSTYTNLVYKILGFQKGQRDMMSSDDLRKLADMEQFSRILVDRGYQYNEVKRALYEYMGK